MIDYSTDNVAIAFKSDNVVAVFQLFINFLQIHHKGWLDEMIQTLGLGPQTNLITSR